MIDQPIVSVVVPAFNAAATITRTLEALCQQDFDAPYEVIVVDDGSLDGTDRVVTEAEGHVRLVRQANLGPAEARNRGVSAGSAPYIAFTDADCIPTPDWLRAGVSALERADLVQGRVLPDPSARRSALERTITVRREYGLYEAANLFVKRDLFERLGGFVDWLPARVGKPLAEDVWFGWRARRAGARTAFVEGATVHHEVFERGPGAYVAEHLRVVYFPAMVAQVPELREAFLFRRWFLTPRTASFDLALCGGLAAAIARRFGRGRAAAALALVASVPYTRRLGNQAKRGGSPVVVIIAAGVAGDATGLGALLFGSARARCLVL